MDRLEPARAHSSAVPRPGGFPDATRENPYYSALMEVTGSTRVWRTTGTRMAMAT